MSARHDLSGIPGVYRNANRHGAYLALSGRPGLLVPVRDHEGRVRGAQVRVDDAGDGGKYRWLSSGGDDREAGTPSGSPLHWTLAGDRGGALWVTEGPLKADVAAYLSGHRFIAFAGAHRGQAQRIVEELHAVDWDPKRPIIIALDADYRTNPHVRRALVAVGTALHAAGYIVRVATWPANLGKAIDDLLLSGMTPDVEPWFAFRGSDVPTVRTSPIPEAGPRLDLVSLDAAHRELRRLAERVLRGRAKGGIDVVQATLGAGKTTAFATVYAELLAKGTWPTGVQLAFVVDTVRDAEDLCATFADHGAPIGSVAMLRGRTPETCPDMIRVEALGGGRHSPAAELCSHCETGKAGACGYLNQRRDAAGASVIVAPKAALFGSADDDLLRHCAVVVCDEGIAAHLVETFDLDREHADAWASGLDREQATEADPARLLVRILQTALAGVRYQGGKHGPAVPAIPKLRQAAAHLGHDLAALVATLAEQKRPKGGRMTFEDPWLRQGDDRRLRETVPIRAFRDLVDALQAELTNPTRDTRLWLQADYPSDVAGLALGTPVTAHLVYTAPKADLLRRLDGKRVCVLDATPEAEIFVLRHLFPADRIRHHTIAVRENIRAVQLTNALRQTPEARERIRSRVRELVGEDAPILVLGRKGHIEHGDTPKGVAAGWFGNHDRATNAFEGARGVILEDFYSPPPDVIRRTVQAVRFAAPPEGRPAEYAVYAGTGFEGLRAGAGEETDADVAELTGLLWSARVRQGIGRARACRQQGAPVQVFVESRVPVAGLRIGELTTADTFCGQALSERQAEALTLGRVEANLQREAEARERVRAGLATFADAHGRLPSSRQLAALAGCALRLAQAALREAQAVSSEVIPAGRLSTSLILDQPVSPVIKTPIPREPAPPEAPRPIPAVADPKRRTGYVTVAGVRHPLPLTSTATVRHGIPGRGWWRSEDLAALRAIVALGDIRTLPNTLNLVSELLLAGACVPQRGEPEHYLLPRGQPTFAAGGGP